MRRSERVHFPGGRGERLAGIIDLPDAEPTGCLVFTHCFTCNKDLKAIVRISRGLAARGFCVLRFDLTGLGGSQGDFSETNFSSNRSDLRAAIEFMSQHVAPPSFLIGHSFGGACSLSLAQHVPSVRGVVAIAAPSDTRHLAELLLRMNPAIASEGVGEVTIGGRPYTIRQEILDDFRAFDLARELSQVSKPALLFHSPADETLGFEHALRIFGLLSQRADTAAEPSPASLVSLADADHLLSNNPADLVFVTEITAAWLTRQLIEESNRR